MCRICSYYTKIDLTQLPTSNPFLDGTTTPDAVELEVDMEVPNTIVIESPESSRHTAWTNPHRFPSLHRTRMNVEALPLAPTTASSPQSTTRTISIYGPRELSRINQHTYNTFGLHDQQRETTAVQDVSFTASLHRKLQHHNRVNSHPRVLTDDSVSEISSQGGTPKNMSPVSDDEEFAYLPSPIENFEARPRRTVPVRKPVNYGFPMNVPIPKPLRFNEYQNSAMMRWT